jgi:hypothetical protein
VSRLSSHTALNPSSDHSFARRHAAGWSAGEVRLLTASEAVWLASGANGENVIEARSFSQREAWHWACQQAESLGRLRR